MTATRAPLDARRARQLVGVLAAGAAVSVGLGVYGSVHDPTGRSIFKLGFSGMPSMKIWLCTLAVVLGVAQVLSALWMYGRLPGVHTTPKWVAFAHRWSGTAAFVATVPVAYHCLWSIGYGNRLASDSENVRRVVHSFFGCVFYGAFTVKMLALRSRRLPGWLLPAAGGLLFAALVTVWFTSALWWFTKVDFPAF